MLKKIELSPRPVSAVETPFVSKRAKKRGGLRTKRSGVSLVGRDELIRQALGEIGVLTGRQIQTLAFPLEQSTAWKRRLTKLIRVGLVSRFPRSSVNDPYVYCLPKKRLPSSALLEHNLGVAELYVRLRRGCADLGFELIDWQLPSTLQALLAARTKLAPDAYAKIQRRVDGELRTAGFFLEYEHTTRSQSVLAHRLTRYADLFHSGGYRELFGHRGMRVLIVYASDLASSADVKLTKGVATARRLGVTLVRFTTIDRVMSCAPSEVLAASIWWQPGRSEPISLFKSPLLEFRDKNTPHVLEDPSVFNSIEEISH